MTSNLLRNRRYREVVSMYLRMASGLDVQEKPFTKLSAAVSDPDMRDLRGSGLERFFLKVRDESSRDLSGGLDQAERLAKEGTEGRFAAVIWNRPQRPAGESYVVMSLATFSELAKVVDGEHQRRLHLDQQRLDRRQREEKSRHGTQAR
jgi:hypothetical protein